MDKGDQKMEMAITMDDRIRAAKHVQPILWKTAKKLTNINAEESYRFYANLLRQYQALTKEQQKAVLDYLSAGQEAQNEGQ